MTSSSPPRAGSRVAAVLEAIALRVVAWGGALALVLVFFGDFRPMLSPARQVASSPADGGAPASEDGPGWPHLRGPRYDGSCAETGLADSWPPEGPPVLWSREIGQGYSGFSVAAGLAYTQTQTLYSQSVVCLDARTGATVWEHRYGWPYEPGGMYPGPRATPTWHAGRVYFASPRGLVGCLDAADGRLVWSRNVVEDFAGRGHDFGYACSPLVEEGKVILPVGGKGASVVALDARDGSTVWGAGDGPASYASALPIALRGRRQVVAFLQNSLAAFDLASGRALWQQSLSQGYDEHSTLPLYREPHLMVTYAFRGGSELYEIQSEDPVVGPDSKVASRRVWSSRQMSNDVASSLLLDGAVYGFDLREPQSKARRPSRGTFKCMDFRTGDVLWTTDRVGHASLIAADGKLILFNDSGEGLLARASREGYEELGRVKLFDGEICWTSPALDQGRLFLRTPTRAACLFVGRPEALDPTEAGAARRAAEVPQPVHADLSWLAGGERRYPADLPSAEELRRWYAWGLVGVLGGAALLAAVVHVALRLCRSDAATVAGRGVFWIAALALAAALTPLANRLSEEFVFTWPAALALWQQLTLAGMVRWRRAGTRRGRWLSVLAGLGLLGVCLGYFHLCRRLDLATSWVFLIGLGAAWPLAVPAAMRMQGRRPFWHDAALAALVFSLFFWSCGGYIAWVRT